LGVAFDPSGNIWVTDSLNDRIEQFSPVPEPSALALAASGGGMWLVGHGWRRCRSRLPSGT